MPFSLAPLPYAFDALEPHIDAKTMEIHYTKHHQTYVNNLNVAVEKHPELFEKTVEELTMDIELVPEDIRTAVRNSGGGHLNHTLFWEMMSPQGGGKPSSALLSAIEKAFGSFQVFQETFEKAALGRFGSGWAWLIVDDDTLKVTSTANQDNPISEGKIPLLCIDVWEHAYYLKYQNKRADYLKAFWNIVHWDEVARRFAESK